MYQGIRESFKAYWDAYGGLHAQMRSPYLHGALLLLLVTVPMWVFPLFTYSDSEKQWWSMSISVLPNLLGFSLGGFALFVGFGDEKFKAILAAPEKDPNLPAIYVGLCASFVHFIVVQVFALIIAFVCKAWWFYSELMEPLRELLPWLNVGGGMIGFGLFLYAVMCALAATMQIFQVGIMYSKFQSELAKQQQRAQ